MVIAALNQLLPNNKCKQARTGPRPRKNKTKVLIRSLKIRSPLWTTFRQTGLSLFYVYDDVVLRVTESSSQALIYFDEEDLHHPNGLLSSAIATWLIKILLARQKYCHKLKAHNFQDSVPGKQRIFLSKHIITQWHQQVHFERGQYQSTSFGC